MNYASRRHFTPRHNAKIVRRQLAGKEAVSALAEERKVQPSQIHLWGKRVSDQAERAFQGQPVVRATQGTDGTTDHDHG